jgi:hypothetical protein
MFSNNTVFIVGAGASYELGLPLGETLKSRICEIVQLNRNDGFENSRFSYVVHEASSAGLGTVAEFTKACKLILTGLPNVASIDIFLDIHQEDKILVEAGKIALVIAILEAERSCSLMPRFDLHDSDIHGSPPSPGTPKKFEDSWFVQLGYLLTQDRTRVHVNEIFDNVSFLTFNYDRCIETFAYNWLKETYGLPPAGAAAIASRLDVLHVYGTIGSPAWTGTPNNVEFGHKHGTSSLAITRDIRTLTETCESDIMTLIRDKIARAETLVFLGFGWLPQNLEILGLEPIGNDVQRIFYTSYGISESDRDTILQDLREMLHKEVTRQPPSDFNQVRCFEERGTCADLFRNHWRQLTR